MNYNFNLSNPFAEPVPFNLEAIQGTPQRAQQGSESSSVIDALRALGMNAGGGGDQSELLRNMMAEWARQMEANRAQEAQLYAQTPRPEEYVRARRYGRDPVGAKISERAAELASHSGLDWFKQANNIPELTPEEILASQGNTARNQWISQRGQGGTPAAGGGINPEELRRLNAVRRSNSYYTSPGRYV
jgi:hypothetical protein